MAKFAGLPDGAEIIVEAPRNASSMGQSPSFVGLPADVQIIPDEQSMTAKVGRALQSAGQWMEDVRKPLARSLRPTLEYGGAALGALTAGTAATPETLGAGTIPAAVAGSALGYSAGKRAANALETFVGARPDEGFVEETLRSTSELPADIVEGAGIEMGGRIANVGIEKALKGIGKVARLTYEKVLKAPPKTVTKEARDLAVSTALENKIAPTEKGLSKLEKMIDSANSKVEDLIKGHMDITKRADQMNRKLGYKQYDEGMIKTDDVLLPVHELRRDIIKYSDEVGPELEVLDRYIAEVKASRGPEMTVLQAQEMKKKIYRELKKAYGEIKSTLVEGKKAVARGTKDEIANLVPEVKPTNEQLAKMYNLDEVLERAVNRTRNYDIIGLSDLVAGGAGATIGGFADGASGSGAGGTTALLLSRAMRSPALMSRLAFGLNSMSRTGAGQVAARGIAGYGFDLGKEGIDRLDPLGLMPKQEE